jgi:hypothetical protein
MESPWNGEAASELASGLGCLGPFFGDGQFPRHFTPRHFIEKSGHNSKKSAQIEYTKCHFFRA